MKLHITLLLGSAVLISVLCGGFCEENDRVKPDVDTATITSHESTAKSSEHNTPTTELTTKATESTIKTTESTTKTTEPESTSKTTELSDKTTTLHTTRSTEPITTNSTSHQTTRGTSDYTTSSVVTSSRPPTPTTAPPTPPIQPTKGMWNVSDHNVTCILLEAGIRMTFSYQKADHSLKSDFILDVPDNATASGTCGSTNQTISLMFFEDWYLNLTFAMNKTSHNNYYDLAMTSLEYKITEKRFPGANDSEHVEKVSQSGDMFMTDYRKKFVCVAAQKLYDNDNATNAPQKIETYSLTFEAFRESSSDKFTDNAKHCEQDQVSQLVPIIVGAALGGLILIVLIAYLIGRKRSRRGYESV